MNIRPYVELDEEDVISLWIACGLVVPSNNPERDIRRKLEVNRELFLVGETDGRLMAAVMGGYEGHRGWINYLAVHPEFQGRGCGGQMMRFVQKRLKILGCPKINLQVRETNKGAMKFYKSIGYIEDKVISLGKRLVSDESENGQ